MSKLNLFLFTSVFIGIASGMLSGCGTKGPLYIPEQRYPQEANAPTNSPNATDSTKADSTQPTIKE